MDPGDWQAFGWYMDNCALFDMDYGLTGRAFDKLDLSVCQARLLKMKLRLIHATAMRVVEKAAVKSKR